MKLISEERLAELLREEARLLSLDAMGVDNWQGGYEDSEERTAYLNMCDQSDKEITKDFKDL